MNEHNSQLEIQKKVFERIRGGGAAHMHSRTYFVARIALTAAVALLTLAVSAFVLSFIVFSIHESDEQFLLGFGSRGVATFFALFPWLSLVADILLLLLLEWLLQGFKIGYRFSLLSVFIGVLAVSTVLAVVVDLTPLHKTLLDRADSGRLPVGGEMYESIRDSHQDQGVFRGTVTSVQGSQFVITHSDGDHDADDGTQTVIVPPDVALDFSLHVGDRVYVLGSLTNGVVQARGIGVLTADQ